MNKSDRIIRILATIILAAVFTGFRHLPWWTMPLAVFILAIYFKKSPGRSFLFGFLAIALLWTTDLLFADLPNHHILSTRMALLFGLPSYVVFLFVNILLGGLVGGLAAWSGALIRKAFFEARPSQPAVIPK